MAFTVDPDRFRFRPELAASMQGRRVLITGAGKDGGLGQAFALAAGLNGAAAVGVHFHQSYVDGFDLVYRLRDLGVPAFPLQADVTNMGDLWASRSYVIEQLGGLPPDLVICNSGLSERGYSFGRALREVDGESRAMRRARVRQHFIDNLQESRLVLDTKLVGFLSMTHLWAGEALHAGQDLRLVYISSRQATDPGPSVPGYVIANWGALALPQVLKVNLAKNTTAISAFSVLYPFVRTGMTDDYADNPKVYGRWQPRMLETHEAAQAFLQLLARPAEETDQTMYELLVSGSDDGPLQGAWRRVRFEVHEDPLDWSDDAPLPLN
ncbi:MAG: SDR family NAD(P)-dependent oxidoreductase [Acidimicrobiales bacterium]